MEIDDFVCLLCRFGNEFGFGMEGASRFQAKYTEDGYSYPRILLPP